jgi:PQQ-dependent catabolism-associated CXXCW motif protein
MMPRSRRAFPDLSRALAIIAFVAGGSWSVSGESCAQTVAEPEGYRMEAFRAPVPETLAGARVVSDQQVLELHASGEVIFIDVLPRPPKPEKLPDDVVWRPRPRKNIPGSVWLVNVGFGALNPETEKYFRSNLERLTAGDKSAGILIYCLADCWMSWNAARRALSYGYSNVYWYPDGTDGWTGLGGETEPSEPVPMTP